MFIVYALISKKDKRIYVGITHNLKRRLKEHNAGRTRSTKSYQPWKLLHFQVIEDRRIARQFEKKWKSGSGREFLKSLGNRDPVAQLDRATAF